VRLLNLGLGLALAVGLPVSFFIEPVLRDFFSNQAARVDPGWLVPFLRLCVVLALGMVAAYHVLLSRLLAMVETVQDGNPFVPGNAARLKAIAWCMLAMQLLYLSFGVMAAAMGAAGSNIGWDLSLIGSLTGWAAVLLLFVLARVFEEGTRIRSDLEGIV